MRKLRVLSLFAGIGGFDLGLERTGGFETVAFCEIDPFCRRVLAKHWPEVPCYHDVRELTAARLATDGIAVDVICGGFPCQDLSVAGNGAGLAGERSGLWSEIARLAGELRPQFVIVENVAALLGRGLGTVLGDLAALGLDAEWHCIPASAVGAPHRRDRVWLVAYPNGGRHNRTEESGICLAPYRIGLPDYVSHGSGAPNVADATSIGQPRPGQPLDTGNQTQDREGEASDAVHVGLGDFWRVEPDVGRVANGVPDRAHRLRCLGNAVVPQIPELIGRAILASLEPTAPFPRLGADTCLRVDGYPLSIGSEALPESPREHHARAAGADLSFHPSTDSAGEAREHA